MPQQMPRPLLSFVRAFSEVSCPAPDVDIFQVGIREHWLVCVPHHDGVCSSCLDDVPGSQFEGRRLIGQVPSTQRKIARSPRRQQAGRFILKRIEQGGINTEEVQEGNEALFICDVEIEGHALEVETVPSESLNQSVRTGPPNSS